MDSRTLPGRRCGALAFGTFIAASVTALALFGGTGDANAAGFALKEQSSTALGNAFAGATAGAEDVSYMFFNPAGLVRHEGNQAAAVLSYIVPNAETTNAVDASGTFTKSSQNGGVNALVPATYGMWSVNSDLKVAVAVNVPFGLSTEYDSDWAGAFYAIESAVETININPAVAYRINPQLSVGFGLQAQFADITLSQFAGAAGIFEVTGDDWGFGFNLGALYEFSPETRVGIGYRSQVKQEISGIATSGLASDGANADLTTPESATLGVYHDYNDNFAVMAEIGWTGWDSFDQIQVNIDSLAVLGITQQVTVPEDWENVWFYALGATWKPNDQWTVRGGLAFDESPVPDATRTPRLPGSDRTWVAVGAQYAVSDRFTIDAGYTHIFFKDNSVDITLAPALNLTADFEGSIDILTAQATFRF